MSDGKKIDKPCSVCGQNCWWPASCGDLPVCEDCVYDEIASLRERLDRAREGFQKIATGRITGASGHNADASRIRARIAKEALRELDSEGGGDE